MKVWLNGKLVERHEAVVNVFDHGLLYGDGVFEGIRAYDGRIFQCRAHLDRLFASAQAIRLAIPVGREQLVAAMEQTLAANGLTNCYIRLVVTRGEGDLGLNPLTCSRSTVFVIADQVKLYPPEAYENGLAVVIARTRRVSEEMLSPRVKSLNYLNNILARLEAIDAGVGEAVMLNGKGQVAEATGDNIFVVRGGIVLTPPAEADILVGVTRRVVLALCQRLGVPALEQTLTVDDLCTAQECFLTGTAAEVIAVTRVDDKVIGAGQPGPITRRLLDAFRALIRSGEEL